MSQAVTPAAQAYTVFEIPCSGYPETFTAVLGGTLYTLTIHWINVGTPGWILDIADQNGNPIANGIPLVTGANLLEQYAYLGIEGQLFVQTDGDIAAPPTFSNLGTTSHLYFTAANS
jgi:hypothetical protein